MNTHKRQFRLSMSEARLVFFAVPQEQPKPQEQQQSNEQQNNAQLNLQQVSGQEVQNVSQSVGSAIRTGGLWGAVGALISVLTRRGYQVPPALQQTTSSNNGQGQEQPEQAIDPSQPLMMTSVDPNYVPGQGVLPAKPQQGSQQQPPNYVLSGVVQGGAKPQRPNVVQPIPNQNATIVAPPQQQQQPGRNIEVEGGTDYAVHEGSLWEKNPQTGGWRTCNEDVVGRGSGAHLRTNAVMTGHIDSAAAARLDSSEFTLAQDAIRNRNMVGKSFLGRTVGGGDAREYLCKDQPWKFVEMRVTTRTARVVPNGDSTTLYIDPWPDNGWRTSVYLGNGKTLEAMNQEVEDRGVFYKKTRYGIEVRAVGAVPDPTRTFNLWGTQCSVEVQAEPEPSLNPAVPSVETDQTELALLTPSRVGVFAAETGGTAIGTPAVTIDGGAQGGACAIENNGGRLNIRGIRAGNVTVYLQFGNRRIEKRINVTPVREELRYIRDVQQGSSNMFWSKPPGRPLTFTSGGRTGVLPPLPSTPGAYEVSQTIGDISVTRRNFGRGGEDSITVSTTAATSNTPGTQLAEWTVTMSERMSGRFRVVEAPPPPPPTNTPSTGTTYSSGAPAEQNASPEWRRPYTGLLNPAEFERTILADDICLAMDGETPVVLQKMGQGDNFQGWRKIGETGVATIQGRQLTNHDFVRANALTFFDKSKADSFRSPTLGARVEEKKPSGYAYTWVYQEYRTVGRRWGRA